jgi:2-dehydropantoate 2-reductase
VRFVVFGAGAIGGAVGGRLFEQGHDVVLIARGEHGRALAETGLVLESPERQVVLRVPVVEHPGELDWSADDVVLLCVKSQDTETALSALDGLAVPTTPVVSMQNGVANEARILRRYAHTYGVCVMLPATHVDPGVVVAHSSPITGLLNVGCYPAGTDDTARGIAQALSASTFDARAVERVMRWKYCKLLNNLGNALEALCGPEARGSDLGRRVRQEAEEVLGLAGTDFASVEEDRERRGDLLQLGASKRSWAGGSSWQSLARGTGSIEADFLNGEIALLGRLHGRPTPANVLLQQWANRAARERFAPGSVPLEQLMAALGD